MLALRTFEFLFYHLLLSGVDRVSTREIVRLADRLRSHSFPRLNSNRSRSKTSASRARAISLCCREGLRAVANDADAKTVQWSDHTLPAFSSPPSLPKPPRQALSFYIKTSSAGS